MSPKDDDDLAGFRDFIDGSNDKSIKAPKRRDNNTQGFELLTFLDNESMRLEKQSRFYEEKIYMLKNYPQQKAINYQLSEELKSQKELLDRMLLKDMSPLFLSLNEILRQFKPES